MWPPPNSRRTWSWFLVACGPGLRQGRKMQREARLGPGGYSKPQQELEPFRAQDQSLDSLLRRGAEISFHMPARHPGSSHPFPEAVRPLWRAGMCLSWLDAPRTLHSMGRSPSPRSPPGPLPQEGWWSAGMRNSSGEEPDTRTPGCPRWDPAHSSAAGGLPGVLRVLGGAERPLPGLVHTHRQSAGDRGTRAPFSLGWRCSGHA